MIINSATLDNEFLGLTNINLSAIWDHKLTYIEFAEYAHMRRWLAETNTTHIFHWKNTGKYLPDSIWLDDDSAVVFKLKYNI